MRIAFVHDWYTLPGGAEKVAGEIIDVIQPQGLFALFNFMNPADLYATTQGKGVRTSFLQQIPGAAEHYRYLAPLYPKAVSHIDLSDYDVIISSSWMAAKGVQKRKGQVHLCYCHTPMRFAWGLESVYLHKYGIKGGIKKWLARWMISRLKKWDRETADEVDYFIANSAFVAKRIHKAYDRKSAIVYPPVNTERFGLHEKKEEYYFTASRLVEYKNIELIIEAFKRLPDRILYIAGTGPKEAAWRRMATPNIRFLGWIENDDMVYRMQRAKAFINASIEDFGIAGLEAQSCGTPVIALGKGGYTETVVEGETGLFFHREHPEALADTILRFERKTFDPYVIRRHAKSFDRSRFREEFLNHFLDKCVVHAETVA